jgi:predicted metalloprotease
MPPGQHPGGFAPVPPARKSRIGTVLLAVVGVVVLLGLGMALLGSLGAPGETAGGISYENESYSPPPADLNPPALPIPDDEEAAKLVLTNNKLYGQKLPQPIRCDIPAIDLMNASNQALKTHMEDVVACLMRAWIVPMEAAGYQLPRPSVTVYETPITTKCGKLPLPNAVYCGADQQIYYSKNLPTIVPPELRNSRFVVESVVAHEFGHALQARTAILISSLYFEKNATSKQVANELSRRTELQADCFDGMFLRSVSQSAGMKQAELDAILQLFEVIGDDALSGKPNIDGNHGLSASRRYWGEMGLASTAISACNTYTAAASTVR